MPRASKTMLAAVITFVLAGATAVFYLLELSGRGPTSDEYRVYGVFLTRLAAENNWHPDEVELSYTTLQLEEPQFPSWIPMGLRTDKMTPPPYGVKFCGYLCGREFVKKNLVKWRLNSTAQGEVGFPIAAPSE